MKIKDLLTKVEIGTEQFSKDKKIKKIQESFDKELEDYKISSLLKEKINILLESESDRIIPIIRNLRSINKRISLYEQKQENEGISKSFGMLKTDSLIKEYNSIMESLSDEKVMKKVNAEHLSEALALVNFKIDQISEGSDYNIENRLLELPIGLDENFNEHYSLLDETIN